MHKKEKSVSNTGRSENQHGLLWSWYRWVLWKHWSLETPKLIPGDKNVTEMLTWTRFHCAMSVARTRPVIQHFKDFILRGAQRSRVPLSVDVWAESARWEPSEETQRGVAAAGAVEGHGASPGRLQTRSLQITLRTGCVCLLVFTAALRCNAALEGWAAATFPSALPKEESVQPVKRATHEKKAGVKGTKSTQWQSAKIGDLLFLFENKMSWD